MVRIWYSMLFFPEVTPSEVTFGPIAVVDFSTSNSTFEVEDFPMFSDKVLRKGSS